MTTDPQPPTDVGLVLPDGTRIPLKPVYDRFEDGNHHWEAVLDDPDDAARLWACDPMQRIAGTIGSLPPDTLVAVQLPTAPEGERTEVHGSYVDSEGRRRLLGAVAARTQTPAVPEPTALTPQTATAEMPPFTALRVIAVAGSVGAIYGILVAFCADGLGLGTTDWRVLTIGALGGLALGKATFAAYRRHRRRQAQKD